MRMHLKMEWARLKSRLEKNPVCPTSLMKKTREYSGVCRENFSRGVRGIEMSCFSSRSIAPVQEGSAGKKWNADDTD
jgi:hypothetical protein